jgi:SAM-dependent methyltransferase
LPDTPRTRLRTTFEQVPELYDRVRPAPPPQVFDDLVALARLPAKARLLEIGCGTAHATLPLAERGYAITCVELGAQLASVARRKLAPFPAVDVVTADFETWRPARAGFDAVVAFGAFHWIAPGLRYAKTADLLRAGGSLAFVSTAHVLPDGGDPFFREVHADYEALVPDAPTATRGFYSPPWRLPEPEALADHSDEVVRAEIEASGRYRDVRARRYLWDAVHTAGDYVALLATYSHHRALDHGIREPLLERIHERIEARPGRTVRATYLAMLYVAERVT